MLSPSFKFSQETVTSLSPASINIVTWLVRPATSFHHFLFMCLSPKPEFLGFKNKKYLTILYILILTRFKPSTYLLREKNKLTTSLCLFFFAIRVLIVKRITFGFLKVHLSTFQWGCSRH
jgi:hypothetical protein